MLDSTSGDVETDLVDLTGVSLSRLRSSDRAPLAPSLDRMLRQVARSRRNLSGTNPPGRID